MSMMRARDALEPETVADIDAAKDCGPYRTNARSSMPRFNHVAEWGEHRHWICEYHEGFDSGVSKVKESGWSPMSVGE